MRPFINISWITHGKIKQYAEEQNLTVDETYQKILEKGLEMLNK